MNTKSIVLSLAAIAALVGAGYGLYSIGMRHGMTVSAAVERTPTVATAETFADNVAAGEAATRRHIKDGLKAGDVDPATGVMPNLKPGDRVEFEFSMEKEGPRLTSIKPLSAGSIK